MTRLPIEAFASHLHRALRCPLAECIPSYGPRCALAASSRFELPMSLLHLLSNRATFP